MHNAHAKDLPFFQRFGDGALPGYLGIEIVEVGERQLSSRLTVQPHHLAPNGFLHAGAVVTLADTSAGYACWKSLPASATGFTTIELKANFLGTARSGAITCTAVAVHIGGSTQIWDATVKTEGDGKTIALFRCTQMILYPRPTTP